MTAASQELPRFSVRSWRDGWWVLDERLQRLFGPCIHTTALEKSKELNLYPERVVSAGWVEAPKRPEESA